MGHSDEIPFVFADKSARLTRETASLSDAIIRYWTRFAAHADPNHASSSSAGNPLWPAVSATSGELDGLVLNTTLRVEPVLEASHCRAVMQALELKHFPHAGGS